MIKPPLPGHRWVYYLPYFNGADTREKYSNKGDFGGCGGNGAYRLVPAWMATCLGLCQHGAVICQALHA